MILGIGVDVCAVSRMRRAIKSEHFVNRVFHRSEIEHARGKADAAASFAAAFAAREAFCKAASVSMYEAALSRGVWIERDGDGRPRVMLSDAVRDKLPRRGEQLAFHVSLSHDADIAIAYVVIESFWGSAPNPAQGSKLP